MRAPALRHSGGNRPALLSLIRHVEQAHSAANKAQRLAAHCSGQSFASVSERHRHRECVCVCEIMSVSRACVCRYMWIYMPLHTWRPGSVCQLVLCMCVCVTNQECVYLYASDQSLKRPVHIQSVCVAWMWPKPKGSPAIRAVLVQSCYYSAYSTAKWMLL